MQDVKHNSFTGMTLLKQLIKKRCLNNQNIVNLICIDTDNEDSFVDVAKGSQSPAKSFIKLFLYVPETIEEQSVFVTMQSGVTQVSSSAVKTTSLMIYIFAHEQLMDMLQGVRTDLLAGYIDEEINGMTDVGFGRLELVSANEFNPIQDYYGQVLEYTLQDHNRIGSKL